MSTVAAPSPEPPVISDPNHKPDPSQAAPGGKAPLDPNAGPASSPAAPVDSWSKGWLKEDGSLDHAVFDKAPDELKPIAKEVGRYKSLDEMLKGISEREKLLGKKGIFDPLPADAPKEAVAERSALLRKATGAPDKPEGYGLTRPEGVPENMWDAKLATNAAQLAHKHALSPNALKDFVALQIASNRETQELFKQADANWFESQDKLIREVAAKEGMDFANTMEFAKRAGAKFGASPDNPIFKNATFVLMAARVGKLLAEDKAVIGDVNDFSLAANMTPAAAEKETLAIKQDKNHPLYSAYWNRDGKHSPEEVKKARETAARYSRIAYADRPQRGGR